MDEDIVIQDEQIQENNEPIISNDSETVSYNAVVSVSNEDIDISTSVFIGFTVAGTMCFISMGIALVLRYFKVA